MSNEELNEAARDGSGMYEDASTDAQSAKTVELTNRAIKWCELNQVVPNPNGIITALRDMGHLKE